MIEKIVFWDHCINSKEPVKCFLVGEVVEDHIHYLVVRWWTCEIEDADHNNEYAVIIRAAIIKRITLIEGRETT